VFRDIVGADYVTDNPPADHPFLTDERHLFRGRAAAIVFPKSAKELGECVRVCNDAGIAMVPQGGNTGYCGGATPDQSGRQILFSLQRLNRVIAVDRPGATITLEAGVILSSAQDIASQHNLLLPLSMGSEGSCQIGGNLSTNAGGLAVLRYGTAKEMVAGLEVVLPDGRIWSDLKGLRKDNTGYDLKQLFLGAEGTLGIITAAVLRLHPLPNTTITAWLSVADIDNAVSMLSELRENLGDCLTSFEYISRESLNLVCEHIDGARDPLQTAEGNVVLVELAAYDNGELLRERLENELERTMRNGTINDCAIAQNDTHRRSFWRLRESIPEAEKRAGGAIKHDVSVEIASLGSFIRETRQALREEFPDCRISLFGHVGDGNVHLNVLAGSDVTAAVFKRDCAEAISSRVHKLACDRHGSFSAEHGIGQLKRDLLADTADPISMELMRKIKQTLDPKGLMNPGKVV
jgi:FAD/FMN-containing dehydrogenase